MPKWIFPGNVTFSNFVAFLATKYFVTFFTTGPWIQSKTISEIRRHRRHPVVLLSSKIGRQMAPDRQMAPPTCPAHFAPTRTNSRKLAQTCANPHKLTQTRADSRKVAQTRAKMLGVGRVGPGAVGPGGGMCWGWRARGGLGLAGGVGREVGWVRVGG